jgi:hypothetical protein
MKTRSFIDTKHHPGKSRTSDSSESGEFDALIDEGIKSEHVPLTDSVWGEIRQRGRKLAHKLANGN